MGVVANFAVSPPIDFHSILVLRRAENWKPELVDVKAWLDSLPPSDQWKGDAILTNAPKLNPGDVIFLVENPAKDAAKTPIEIRKKLRQLDQVMMNGRPRPRIEPPPAPSH